MPRGGPCVRPPSAFQRGEVGLEGPLAAAAVGQLLVQPGELLGALVDGLVEDDHVVALEEIVAVVLGPREFLLHQRRVLGGHALERDRVDLRALDLDDHELDLLGDRLLALALELERLLRLSATDLPCHGLTIHAPKIIAAWRQSGLRESSSLPRRPRRPPSRSSTSAFLRSGPTCAATTGSASPSSAPCSLRHCSARASR